MLVQPTEDEGAPSERPSEAQPTPSPTQTSEVPLVSQTDPSPPHSKKFGGNLGVFHSSVIKSLSGNEGEMTLQSVYDLCISLCTQVSDQAKEIQHLKAQIKKFKKQAKPVVKHHKAWMKSVSLKQRLARKSNLKEHGLHKRSLYRRQEKISTDDQNEGTDEQSKGTDEHTEEERATQTTQPPTSTIFRDDETIAQVLLNMSQAKQFQERRRKPLPKIDPKDKGKKKIEEEDESEVQEGGKMKKKRNQLAEEARIQNDALIRNYDDIKAELRAD
ncbi:hypothetical protein Tco_0903173 [Tanacetum coccineum]